MEIGGINSQKLRPSNHAQVSTRNPFNDRNKMGGNNKIKLLNQNHTAVWGRSNSTSCFEIAVHKGHNESTEYSTPPAAADSYPTILQSGIQHRITPKIAEIMIDLKKTDDIAIKI